MSTGEIKELLRTYRQRMKRLLANAPSGLADEMLPSLGPSLTSETEVAALALKAAIVLPPSLLGYLCAPAVERDLEWSEIVVPGNTDLSRWRVFFAENQLLKLGLLQVAMGPCGDPVCLDFSRRRKDGECPVVVINHDRLAADHWSSEKAVREHVSVEFDSFLQLLRVVCEGTPVQFRNASAEG